MYYPTLTAVRYITHWEHWERPASGWNMKSNSPLNEHRKVQLTSKHIHTQVNVDNAESRVDCFLYTKSQRHKDNKLDNSDPQNASQRADPRA